MVGREYLFRLVKAMPDGFADCTILFQTKTNLKPQAVYEKRNLSDDACMHA